MPKEVIGGENVMLDSSHIHCKSNYILVSMISRYLVKNGFNLVDKPEKADYFIINTCGYVESERTFSKDLIRKYLKCKKDSEVISVGCLNKIEENLSDEIPGLTIIEEIEDLDKWFFKKVRFSEMDRTNLDESERIYLSHIYLKNDLKNVFYRIIYPILGFFVSWIESVFKKKLNVGFIANDLTFDDKMLVEIGTGCIGKCSYCVIKKAKGRVISRPVKDIIEDIEKVFDSTKSLCLVADDCGSYGLESGDNLFRLVDEINNKFPNIPISIPYVNPYWIQKQPLEYLDLVLKANIKSINVSLQSGSNRIIKAMNRQYNVEKVLEIVDKIREKSPRTTVFTHIIIGFPSEDENDFKKSISAIDHFDVTYYFPFSMPNDDPNASICNCNNVSKRTMFIRMCKMRMKVYEHTVRSIISTILS